MPVEIRVPAMGEGITDVTITKWLVAQGDKVNIDTPIVEIATDKVDSEIVSTHEGVIEILLFSEGDVVKIGEPIVLIGNSTVDESSKPVIKRKPENRKSHQPVVSEMALQITTNTTTVLPTPIANKPFISPFVRQLAMSEGLSTDELDTIVGTGINHRITKEDIISFIEKRPKETHTQKPADNNKAPQYIVPKENEVHIELDRMRKLIATNMVASKKISPHVTSFVEANVSRIVNWRDKVKTEFQKTHNEKLTYLPIIIASVAKALKDFPHINASLQNDKLIIKKDINIGIATALPNGNLIVPVIKKADTLTISGLAKAINNLSGKARNAELHPSDIQGSTFTVSNIGTIGNIGGIPIINQPELAILAIGTFIKKPIAVKTNDTYGIAINDVAELWLSYDHRIIDGYLGGSFLKRIADYIEQFDEATVI